MGEDDILHKLAYGFNQFKQELAFKKNEPNLMSSLAHSLVMNTFRGNSRMISLALNLVLANKPYSLSFNFLIVNLSIGIEFCEHQVLKPSHLSSRFGRSTLISEREREKKSRSFVVCLQMPNCEPFSTSMIFCRTESSCAFSSSGFSCAVA